MEIKLEGKYKSIKSFHWKNIPQLVLITGPNGSGKSQLLELIHNRVTGRKWAEGSLIITGKDVDPDGVIFVKGEWQLQNTSDINLGVLQTQMDEYYKKFQAFPGIQNAKEPDYYIESERSLYTAFWKILKITGQYVPLGVKREEFDTYFPEILIEQESQLSQKIGEIFYRYRLQEIDLLVKGESPNKIVEKIGRKPWEVLREIIKEARLSFEINDPSSHGVLERFQLHLYHQTLNERINFNDLSSGEKVLISLVFYLYNSTEKKIFPKLMLLDEPDAHLHPSMMQHFLNVVKNVLVDKLEIQVFMTTHSPSTVVFAPEDSIYELSVDTPGVKKSNSKNHSISLLTAGLIYVGEGTKYFLVEDKDDVSFYSYIYKQLVSERKIDANIPFVFIPASTKDASGGKSVVINWVNKLHGLGLLNIFHGLIDNDNGNEVSEGVYKIKRYSIENYLADPILVYAALLDKEKNPPIEGLELSIGEEYRLKSLPNEILQRIADKVIDMVIPELEKTFLNFSREEIEKEEVAFSNEVKLLYPKWLLDRRGKDIINRIYLNTFKGQNVSFDILFKALKKVNMFPSDLVDKFNEMKG